MLESEQSQLLNSLLDKLALVNENIAFQLKQTIGAVDALGLSLAEIGTNLKRLNKRVEEMGKDYGKLKDSWNEEAHEKKKVLQPRPPLSPRVRD